MTLNPSKVADFVIDEDGKIIKHHAENAEINSQHFCSVSKMTENLCIFYSNIATLSIPTVTDFKQSLDVNI